MTKNYGEHGVRKDKWPEGLVLRETEESVLLEQYFPNGDCDVIHSFAPGTTLLITDMRNECFEVAREYAEDDKTPIHVWSCLEQMGELAVQRLPARKNCMGCPYHFMNQKPWLGMSMFECKKCTRMKN